MEPTWGDQSESTEIYGLEMKSATYKKISPDDKKYENYQHAAHVLLFSPTDKISLKKYERKAVVLMQMRFDGYLGFPGGLVDAGENPVQAVNRELVEEVGYNLKTQGKICQSDHLFTHLVDAKKLVLHFYAKQLTEEQLEEIIIGSTGAVEYGQESLGIVIVPLYTMGDGYRGFPAFLRHNFIGNAKDQLTSGLIKLGIISNEDVETALAAKPACGCSNCQH